MLCVGVWTDRQLTQVEVTQWERNLRVCLTRRAAREAKPIQVEEDPWEPPQVQLLVDVLLPPTLRHDAKTIEIDAFRRLCSLLYHIY